MAGAVEPGTYIVTLTANGKTLTKPVTVLADQWLPSDRETLAPAGLLRSAGLVRPVPGRRQAVLIRPCIRLLPSAAPPRHFPPAVFSASDRPVP